MKIVIGSESFFPNVSGVAVHAELLARSLAKDGHEVYVFAPSRSFLTHYDKDFKEYKVFRLKSIKNPFRKNFRIAFFPQKQVLREIAKISPDIIHLQDPTSICSSLLKSAKKRKIKLVITNHFSLDYVISYVQYLKPIHSLLKKILMNYLSSFYNKADFIFCPTETVRKELLKWGVNTEIKAVSNGVDIDRFFSYSLPSSIRLKYHLPENRIVLYAGRIDKDKSIDVLINAIPLVLKKANAHFLLLGGGDLIPKMKKLTEELNIERAVTFFGQYDHDMEDLPKLYQIATVFSIPSAIETQSIVTLEAMASGLPIVSANAGALPELVKNGKNGYLFPKGDSNKMADSIIKILKSDEIQKSMKENSLLYVSNHQIEKSQNKIIKTYETILSKSK